MEDDRITRLDAALAKLQSSIDAGDRVNALDLYLAFDTDLTHYVHGEERLLFPALERFTSIRSGATASMRTEHRSLRRLVDLLGELIARGDTRRAVDLLGSLRSVLMFHVVKEEWILQPLG